MPAEPFRNVELCDLTCSCHTCLFPAQNADRWASQSLFPKKIDETSFFLSIQCCAPRAGRLGTALRDRNLGSRRRLFRKRKRQVEYVK
jgi:hypothetical protein